MKKELILIITCFVSLNLFAWTTPTLNSPANASIQWAGVNLDWGAVSNSENYEVQIDTTMNFNSPVFQNQIETYISSSSSNNDTQHFTDDLLFGETYYWRVRSWVANDTSSWSVIRSFDVRDYVTLSSPADNSTQWSGVNLNWNSHSGVDFYEVQVDTVLAFNSSAFQSQLETYISSSSGNNDTQHFMDDLFFGETYYWRVRAINAVDTSEWSVIRSFDVRDYVTLSSPADFTVNASATGVNLNWNSHHGVDFYTLQWDTTNQFNSGALQTMTETYISSSSGNGDTQHNTGTLLANQTYFWRVRAINAVDTSTWSSRVFSTGTVILEPQIPVLISPSNSSTIAVTAVNLIWNSSINATEYEVQYSEQINFAANTSAITTATNENIVGLTNLSTYYWRVRSIHTGFYSDWSTIWSFDVDSVICTPTTSSISVSSCDSYTTPSGITLSNSTIYDDVIPNSAGCDSTITINLTINNSTTGVDTQESCSSYTWIDGITYTSSNNTATHTLTNIAGCDSIITLDLIIESIDLSVTASSNTFSANQTGAQYQWINCSDSSIIDGATDQSYTPSSNGSYAVIISSSSCTDTSECVTSNVGIDSHDLTQSVRMYPNPTKGIFSLEINGNYSEMKIQITNSLGQLISETNHKNSSVVNSIIDGKAGLYFVHVIVDNQTVVIRMVKN